MKTFFRKIIICLFLLLLVAGVSEWLVRRIPNEYKIKAAAYDKNAEKFQVLILGTSYSLHGLNPDWFDLYTFNGGHVLQSLDLDAKIFSKYENRLKSLQYIVIPITFASFFFELQNSTESRLIKNYSIYYGIHATRKPADQLEILSLPFPVNRTRLYEYYIQHKTNINITAAGFDSTYHYTGQYVLDRGVNASDALERLNGHDFVLYEKQKACLEQLIGECARKNIRVILFTPPAHPSFYSSADSAAVETSIATCRSIEKEYPNVRYANFLHDSLFVSNDFYDMSHLNDSGAKKLSLAVNTIITKDKAGNQ